MTPRGKVLAWASRALPLLWGCAIYPDVAAAQKLYWADVEADTIFRSNLDGSDVEPVVNVEDAALHGLAVDSTAGRLYWSDSGSSETMVGRIRRADLDGANPETLLETPREFISWLTIDAVNGHIYWVVQRSVKKICRANLDGTDVVTLVTPERIPNSLSLDISGGFMYWMEWDGVHRSALDGSGSEVVEVFDKSPLSLRQIAFEPTERQLYLVAEYDSPEHEMYQWEFGTPTQQRVEISSRGMGIIAFDDVSRTVYWNYGYATSELTIRRTSFSGCGTQDVMRVNVEPYPVTYFAFDGTARPALDLAWDLCPNEVGTPRPAITQAAVFGTQAFNPSDIDPSSLRLERSDGLGGEIAPLGFGSRRLSLEDVGSAGKKLCGCSSSDPDGHLDAVIRFSAADIRKLVRKGDSGEAVRLTLQGQLKDGRPLASVDCIQPVP